MAALRFQYSRMQSGSLLQLTCHSSRAAEKNRLYKTQEFPTTQASARPIIAAQAMSMLDVILKFRDREDEADILKATWYLIAVRHVEPSSSIVYLAEYPRLRPLPVQGKETKSFHCTGP